MVTIVFTKGLPASGKSTWAKSQQAIRISKDDIRDQLHGGVWSKKNEREVIAEQERLIKYWIPRSNYIIIDDTNFNPNHKKRIAALVSSLGVAFSLEEKIFPTSLQECIARDKKRENSVGEEVIIRMFNENEQEITSWTKVENSKLLPSCIICDIDGTLADHRGVRSAYDTSRYHLDNPFRDVIEIVNDLSRNRSLVLVSGRMNVFRKKTHDWLSANGIKYSNLFMREDGDERRDDIIKREIYMNNIHDKYRVDAVIDDRLRVCRMWHSLGLPLFRVGNPDANF